MSSPFLQPADALSFFAASVPCRLYDRPRLRGPAIAVTARRIRNPVSSAEDDEHWRPLPPSSITLVLLGRHPLCPHSPSTQLHDVRLVRAHTRRSNNLSSAALEQAYRRVDTSVRWGDRDHSCWRRCAMHNTHVAGGMRRRWRVDGTGSKSGGWLTSGALAVEVERAYSDLARSIGRISRIAPRSACLEPIGVILTAAQVGKDGGSSRACQGPCVSAV